MSTTESATAFQLAAESFAHQDALGRSFPNDGFDAGTQDLLDPLRYRRVGPVLAYCQLSPDDCGAMSVTKLVLCMPSNCRSGETVQMFYFRTESPQVMYAAQRYAAYLLSLRRGG